MKKLVTCILFLCLCSSMISCDKMFGAGGTHTDYNITIWGRGENGKINESDKHLTITYPTERKTYKNKTVTKDILLPFDFLNTVWTKDDEPQVSFTNTTSDTITVMLSKGIYIHINDSTTYDKRITDYNFEGRPDKGYEYLTVKEKRISLDSLTVLINGLNYASSFNARTVAPNESITLSLFE